MHGVTATGATGQAFLLRLLLPGLAKIPRKLTWQPLLG